MVDHEMMSNVVPLGLRPRGNGTGDQARSRHGDPQR
jgi:hypothetical protein